MEPKGPLPSSEEPDWSFYIQFRSYSSHKGAARALDILCIKKAEFVFLCYCICKEVTYPLVLCCSSVLLYCSVCWHGLFIFLSLFNDTFSTE